MIKGCIEVPKRAVIVMEDLLSKTLDEIKVEYLYDKGVIIPYIIYLSDNSTATLQLVIDTEPYLEVVISKYGKVIYQTNRLKCFISEIKIECAGNEYNISVSVVEPLKRQVVNE